jgi:hypothetical protein
MILLKNKLFIYLFLLQLYIQFIEILCISSGANEPIADNELGLTAKDCSMQYCLEKDSLGLWLSLQNVCSEQNANPYFLEINSSQTTIYNNYSPLVVGSLCAMTSLISLLLGYNIGHSYHKSFVYSKVKEEDDF